MCLHVYTEVVRIWDPSGEGGNGKPFNCGPLNCVHGNIRNINYMFEECIPLLPQRPSLFDHPALVRWYPSCLYIFGRRGDYLTDPRDLSRSTLVSLCLLIKGVEGLGQCWRNSANRLLCYSAA